MVISCSFFFFQAEDGIRDYKVTGVQTCALPISRDRVDWAAKKFLLNALQEEEKLSWSDPWLQSIDLEYHNLDLDRGLYYELVRKGLMRRVTTEDEIKAAIFNPPETTRAFFRGRAVARFNDEISSIQWDEIVFSKGAYL